jgi:hypothetical protein
MQDFFIREDPLKLVLFKVDHTNVGMGETNRLDMVYFNIMRIMAFGFSQE